MKNVSGKILQPFFSALRFLTVIPVPLGWCGEVTRLEESLPWFPVAGLLVGAVAALADSGFCRIFPFLPASVMTVIFMLAVSGGLHMDGLADTADGFFSSRPKSQILAIMKDSRIGAMGVMAIVAVFSLKVAALASIGPGQRFSVILLVPMAGRCAPVFMMTTLPYAREKGLGSVFGSHRSRLLPLFSYIALIVTAGIAAGSAGIAAAIGVIATVGIFSFWCRKKIGGYTGDTLGAMVELAETVTAVILLAALNGAGSV